MGLLKLCENNSHFVLFGITVSGSDEPQFNLSPLLSQKTLLFNDVTDVYHLFSISSTRSQTFRNPRLKMKYCIYL